MKEIDLDEMIKEWSELEDNYTMWDKVVIFFYRTFGNVIDFFRYDLVQGLKNFWHFKKVIWRHRWWDYSYTDDLVEEAYKIMAENWHKNHYVGGDKDEKELKHIVGLFKKKREIDTFTVDDDEEDIIRKEIYRLIARKRYWD